MNYSELLQLAKGWGNFMFYRTIIWRLLWIKVIIGINVNTISLYKINTLKKVFTLIGKHKKSMDRLSITKESIVLYGRGGRIAKITTIMIQGMTPALLGIIDKVCFTNM